MISIGALALKVLPCLLLVAANSFNVPSGGYEFTAGEPTTITWNASTDGTVTLELNWGSIISSEYSEDIATHIKNSGRFTWTPPRNITDRSNYTICLIPDEPPQDWKCLPEFSITGAGESDNRSPTTTETSAVATSTPSPTSPSDSDDSTSAASNTGLSTGAKAGIGIGVVGIVLLLVLIGVFCVKRRRAGPGVQAVQSHDAPPQAIPLSSPPASHHPPSIEKYELSASNKVVELHSSWTASELSGGGLRELDGSVMRPGRHEVVAELPATEHRFI